jgi:hypothetical protein
MPISIGSPLRTKGLSAREDERQDRKNARAYDGQDTAEIRQQKQDHGGGFPG